MDSTARCFAGGLRQFGIYRDQRCRLSGGRIVDVDHIDEVHDGGPTSAGNGQGLAKNPHVIKDHPDIHVSVVTPQPVGDGFDKLRANAPTVAWTMPTGHTYPLLPPPTLGEGSRPTTIAASAPRDTQAADARLRDLRRRFEQPPTRTPKRRRPFVVRQEQRRYQRTQGRYDRQDTREDTALRRDADQTHRRHARQARDRRRQRRQRHPA
ncbi:MAG: hypothetical protein H0V48_09110, partial [Nocardioidaceae bacterium]|nr:hypothetical protein [Nocardioidaceae bacterium]